jgi:hypothetical protein
VFHRDEGFTQDDPVARIEARRLPRTLERYYLVSRENDPVRIDIPKGKYVPFFAWNGRMAEPSDVERGPPPGPSTTTELQEIATGAKSDGHQKASGLKPRVPAKFVAIGAITGTVIALFRNGVTASPPPG